MKALMAEAFGQDPTVLEWFMPHEAKEMKLHAVCPDAAAAERAIPALERSREALIRRFTDEDVGIEDPPRQAENEITGSFVVQRFTGPLAERTGRFLNNLEQHQRRQYRWSTRTPVD